MGNGVLIAAAICFLLAGVRLVEADMKPNHIEISGCEGEEVVFLSDVESLAHYQLEQGGVLIQNTSFVLDKKIALRHADQKNAGHYDLHVVFLNQSTQLITFNLSIVKGCPDLKGMKAPDIYCSTSGPMSPLPKSKKVLVTRGSFLICSVRMPMADPHVVGEITMPQYNITMDGYSRSDCIKHIPVDTRIIGWQKISIVLAFKSRNGRISRNSASEIQVQVEESSVASKSPLMTTPPTREMTSPEPQSDSSWSLGTFMVGLILLALQLKTAFFEHRIWRDRNAGQKEEAPNAEKKEEEIPMIPVTSEVKDAMEETAAHIGDPPAPRQDTTAHVVVTFKQPGTCLADTEDRNTHP